MFGLSEFRGAVGDLGTTLPLAFMLIISNGYPVVRIFFLWGLAYIAVGWYYKVPISIQPLKAMAVIAITGGFPVSFLSSTAVLYGILLLLLTSTGLIQWLNRWFSKAIVRGIQLGIGLLLAYKAWELVAGNTLYLNGSGDIGNWIFLLSALVMGILFLSTKWLGRSVALELIVISIGISLIAGISLGSINHSGTLWQWNPPEWSGWWNMATLLIIPQLPLTLGNAVYAADDACHTFWPKQSKRVSPGHLAGSIGLLDIFIGLFGGFPICHGAGGIAAHQRFSGKTGGTVIILGIGFVILALLGSFSTLLFLIPIPILGVLLLFDSWQMITLTRRLVNANHIVVALAVGIFSFATHNLFIALLIGLTIEYALDFWSVNIPLPEWLNQLTMHE